MPGPAKSRNPRNPIFGSGYLSKFTKSTAYKSKSTCKKRNPTPATKSTGTPPKANYRSPPALDREPRFLNVVAYMAVEMRFCTDRCGYGIFTRASRDAMLARVIAIATFLSVCLSVRPSRAGIVSKRRKLAA